MTNYVRSFYISKVPFLPFLRPIPKANEKKAATSRERLFVFNVKSVIKSTFPFI